MKSLQNALRESSRILYSIVLVLFLLSKFSSKFYFRPELVQSVPSVQQGLLIAATCIMIFHVAYTFIWKAIPTEQMRQKVLKGAGVCAGVFALWFLLFRVGANLSVDQINMILCTYLVLFSYGKQFRMILLTFLSMFALFLVFAVLGIPLGYTQNRILNGGYGDKYTLGMVHANLTAALLFMILLICWYLLLQKWESLSLRNYKSLLLTVLLFWGGAVPMAVFLRCRTVVALMLLVPVLALAADKLPSGLFMALPFGGLGVSLLLCSQMEFLHRATYHGALRNFSERFVQGGIALHAYGMGLFGGSFGPEPVTETLNGETIRLHVMDNAYVTYGIMNGLIWLIPVLLWLGYAIFLASRRKDVPALVISAVLLLFALMERRGLDPAYNILFFYPLTTGVVIRKETSTGPRKNTGLRP